MMERPLLISSLIDYAARFHADGEIVSREADKSLFRYTYGAAAARIKRVANGLRRLGINEGDRVATLAWNNHRHFELYFGVSGIGAVLHTVNPRLFHAQLAYMINHAQDRVVFLDLGFLPLVEALAPEIPGVEHFVVLCAAAQLPATGLRNVIAYEDWIAAEREEFDWPQIDERSASSLCYTSGTTGNPKGALYSHRSTLLHTFGVCMADTLGIKARDTVLSVVPMFHVNAWGTPYAAALVGAKFVLPGQHLDGESLCALFRDEKVTIALGVPTVWLGALKHVETTNSDFGTVQTLVVGGSAAPPVMIETLRERYGVNMIHAWGMTEMSPIGTVAGLKAKHVGKDEAELSPVRESQGRPCYLVDLKIVDTEGRPLPWDGKTVGDLYVRGPCVIERYYQDEDADRGAFDREGWFKTGDVCSIDPDGYMRITDRSKDVIKSGGEWISSIDLENAAIGFPGVAEAAVIGVPHPKWDERPLLIVVPKDGIAIDKPALLAFLAGRVAKWWLPDDVVVVDEIPHTATGKILKTELRTRFGTYRLPGT